MMNMMMPLALVLINIAYLELQFVIEKGNLKRWICYSLIIFIMISSIFFHLDFIGFAIMFIISFLFVLFYSEELLQNKTNYFLGNITIFIFSFILGIILLNKNDYLLVTIIFTSLNYLLILFLRKQRSLFVYLIEVVFMILCVYIYLLSYQWYILLIVMTQVIMNEYIHKLNQTHYEVNTRDFQSNVMMHHYEEVKTVYLNMRGWRHDYHNHLQTIKAYLQMGELEQINHYLLELEEDLDKVDTLVKSGNLMCDAILNSKLSLALNKNIRLNHTVAVPECISVSDLDLCVILGNLLDNAIEACMKVNENDRFIRIYMSILKQQLYISITNSALEDLNFNERNYISEKRGNHGHGMKRVKLTVDKYNGYLNLQNEPGVFVSEVMLPLVHEF